MPQEAHGHDNRRAALRQGKQKCAATGKNRENYACGKTRATLVEQGTHGELRQREGDKENARGKPER